LFRTFEFGSFEFVSDFEFRFPRRSDFAKAGASDLNEARVRSVLHASGVKEALYLTGHKQHV
jgi:hypothetical protein